MDNNEIYIEIRDQKHEMLFEGTSDKKPEKQKIKIAIIGKGFIPYVHHIWYDSIQKIWRFNGEIRSKYGLFKVRM